MNDTTNKKTPAVRQHDEGPANHVDAGSKMHSTRRVPAMCEKCGAVRTVSARFRQASPDLQCAGCGRVTPHKVTLRIPGEVDGRETVKRTQDAKNAKLMAEIEFCKDVLRRLDTIAVVCRPDSMCVIDRDSGRPKHVLVWLDRDEDPDRPGRWRVYITDGLTLAGEAAAYRRAVTMLVDPQEWIYRAVSVSPGQFNLELVGEDG